MSGKLTARTQYDIRSIAMASHCFRASHPITMYSSRTKTALLMVSYSLCFSFQISSLFETVNKEPN
jgi:hypothetical protein